MNIIEAVEKKEKKEGKIIYSFSIENEMFEAHNTYGQKPILTLFHHGTECGKLEIPNKKVQLTINTEKTPINITAWIETGILTYLSGRTIGGAGIEINGKPVQHTLADPNTHIKSGKTGLFALLFLYIINSIFQIVTGGIYTGIFYLLLIIILLVAILKYKKWQTFSLIAGIILALLQFFDYIIGIFFMIQAGELNPNISMLIWIAIRVGILVNLFNAFKWKLKLKKQ